MATRPLEDLYSFKEQRFTAFSHSVRVFIHGADVSAWLRGAVTINYSSRDGFNTASLELDNPRKIFQFTYDDLKNGVSTGEGEYDTEPKRRIFALKNSPELNLAYPVSSINIKRSIIGSTQQQSSNEFTSENAIASSRFHLPGPLGERRYRMAVNDCIFNKHDWIRIFIKNPMTSAANQWVEVFCGFVTDHPVTTNHLTGSSKVTINASCIRHMMMKMRVQTNVHLADLDPQIVVNAGFYSDFIKPSQYSHPFAISGLEETLRLLVLGRIFSEENTPTSTERGVGEFTLGNIICYDPENPGNTLENWHLMTTFGVNKVTFPRGGGLDDLWLSTSDMIRIGEATYASPASQLPVRGPTGRYLHMLLPKKGTGADQLVQYYTMNGSNAAQLREWTTRWEVIRDFASKLDFQVMTSPSGDILVEFPQYGFTPCAYLTNFGEGETITTELSGLTEEERGAEKPFVQCDQTSAGHLANLFIYNLHQKEETLNDEAEDFPTILTVGGGFAFPPTGVSPKQEVFAPRAYVYSPALVARYGVIAESVDFPYAGQRPEDLGTTGVDSAIVRRLGQLGLIEYTKRMSDASTWQGSLVYRPFMFPNRPVELKKSARIGTLSSVSYTWNVGQDASMSLSMHMLMAKRLDDTNGKTSYRLLTGAINTPLDYGAIWGPESKSKELPVVQTQNSGTHVEVATKQPQTTYPKDTPPKEGDGQAQNKTIPSDTKLEGLYPPFRRAVERMLASARKEGMVVTVNNGFRTPQEQESLLEKGDTTVHGGYSLHNYGMAVDLTVYKNGKPVPKKVKGPYRQLSKFGKDLIWGGNFVGKNKNDNVHFHWPGAALRNKDFKKMADSGMTMLAIWNAQSVLDHIPLYESDQVAGSKALSPNACIKVQLQSPGLKPLGKV